MDWLIPAVPPSPDAIITLTTDFGLCDAYVAAMKGAILQVNPAATIIDISHSIEPQNIGQGAFVLSTACPYFPQDAIHVVVVDPGVGSRRRAIIVETESAIFVAPDNGVLSYVVEASTGKRISRAALMKLPPGLQAFEITNAEYWRQPVSPTFHGRDIFAPVAAHVSLGKRLDQMGQAIGSIAVFPPPRPKSTADGNLVGHIVHIDHFGNIITDVTTQYLPVGEFHVEVAGQKIDSLSEFYDRDRGFLALIGSTGRLEIARKGGSAARLLGSKIGDRLRVVTRSAGHAGG